ncbi:hypothetical protein EON83_01595 [bacterium]|nr:MAG: hypothetical protein EON83_01595 [bacterium]
MNTLTLALERASLIGVAALLVAWLAQKILEARVPAAWRVWIWRVALLQTALALLPLSPMRVAVLPSLTPPSSVTTGVSRTAFSEPKNLPATSSGAGKATSPKPPATNTVIAAPMEAGNVQTGGDVDAAADSSQLEVIKLWCYWNQDKIWLALQGLYIVGVGFQLIRLMRSSRRLRRALRAAVGVEDKAYGQGLRKVARRMDVTSLPRLVHIKGSAPFLVGIFRPCIVLPEASALPQQECETILSHELAHMKRRDLAWNIALWGIQAALWFHPLVWVSRYFLPLETESACDEMVLASTHVTPSSYGNLLLNTLSMERTPLAAGVTDGFSMLKTRLLRLNHAPKTPERASKIIFASALGLTISMALPIRLVSRSQAAPNQMGAAKNEDSEQKKALIAKIGIVQGTVLTPDGKPVKGARISWVNYNGKTAGGRENILASTQSDAQGNFRFEDSKALLQASLKFIGPTQQIPAPQLLIEADGWGCFAERITSKPPTQRVLHLTQPTELQTTFFDPQGKPIANLPVRLSFVFFEKPEGQPSDFKYIHFGGLKHFNAVTDANGVLRMGGLPQGGRARLTIDDERFANLEYQTSEVDLARQAQTIANPMRLVAGATLRGRITNGETGKPVAAIEVGAQGQDATSGWGEAISDKDGYYRISMLGAGRYNLALALDDQLGAQWTAPAQEGVSVSTGSQKENIDFKLERGVLITGNVVTQGSGQPVEGAMIGIYGPAHPKSSAWVQGATTAADGSYQLRVPAGDQYIYVSGVPEGFIRPEGQPISTMTLGGKHSTPYEFTAEDGQDETIDWQLTAQPEARDVRVRVLDANGQVAKGAQIEFSPTGAENGSSTGVPEKQTADDEGRAVLENVRGSIQVWARLGQNATTEAKEVLGGQNVTLNLQPNALIELRGSIVDDEGKPLPNIKVDLFRWTQSSGRLNNSVLSDAQGGYSFAGLLPSATYSLSAKAPGHGQGQVERFQLKPSETRTQKEFVLARTLSFIEGRVVDADEKPVAAATVWISGTKTGSVQVKTDEQGNFRTEEIVPNEKLSLLVTLDNRFGMANVRSGSTGTVIVVKKR